LRRTGGRTTKEFVLMLTDSSWVHADISWGSTEIRLFDMFSSVRSVNERGNFGGILEITLSARLQDTSVVFLMRW